ncbi:MAG: hypothetical protein ACOY4O_07340 [Pseudomonadota bacterium]
MEFTIASPSIVKSIRQRDLLNAWLRLFAKDQRPPDYSSYRPDRFEEEMLDILQCTVEHIGSAPRIVIEADCARMFPAFGPSGKGQTLDDYVGPKTAPMIIPNYHECIRLQRPVYTASKLKDVDGRPVEYERLLLPFSDGTRVNRIVASLKAISEDGRFEIANLMRNDEAAPAVVVRSVIDRDLVPNIPGRNARAAEIELS